MNRILSRALALVHTVIEYASIDGGRIIVGVRPWTSFGLRCPVCGRAANATTGRQAAAVARDGPGEVDLSALGLHEMAASLPDYVRMVAAGERGFASAFEEMTRVEVAAREVRITNQRIRSSGFPYVKGWRTSTGTSSRRSLAPRSRSSRPSGSWSGPRTSCSWEAPAWARRISPSRWASSSQGGARGQVRGLRPARRGP